MFHRWETPISTPVWTANSSLSGKTFFSWLSQGILMKIAFAEGLHDLLSFADRIASGKKKNDFIKKMPPLLFSIGKSKVYIGKSWTAIQNNMHTQNMKAILKSVFVSLATQIFKSVKVTSERMKFAIVLLFIYFLKFHFSVNVDRVV